MKTEIKTKWVESLRSGNYTQGKNKLFDGKNHCCLGVLCDLYSKEKWDYRYSEFEGKDLWYFNDQSEMLPDEVMRWAGLYSTNPNVNFENPESSETQRCSIAELNDSGYTFEELSNYIEQQF
jgi:hypothetical protein